MSMGNTKMTNTKNTVPKNFEEFLEHYKNETIVRRLFPKKEVKINGGKIYSKVISNNGKTAKCRSYPAFCIQQEYQISELDKPGHSYEMDKKTAYELICATEDFVLLNGDEINYVDGLNKIAVEFIGTPQEAIEKYNPVRIIANRQTLKNINTSLPKDENRFIDDGKCYLFPEITPDIAEFVVWKDVYEDPIPTSSSCGISIYSIYEWVGIAIHKPEKFIKVTIAAK